MCRVVETLKERILMSKFQDKFFESHDAHSEVGIMNGFVIATKSFGWQLNPIGLRVDISEPDEDKPLEEPMIGGILFWAGRIRIIRTCSYDVKSLRELFTGYEFFPSDFKDEEVARLEKQLEIVRRVRADTIASRAARLA